MSLTLHPAIEQFLEHLRVERNYSAHTLRNYRSDLEAFFHRAHSSGAARGKPSRKKQLPIWVDYLKIREYLGQLYSQRRKPTTIARKLAALRSFYRYACREGLVKENPAKLVASPRLPQTLPEVMTAEETNRLIDGVGQDAPASQPGTPALLARDRLILELLYGAGLRVSELVGLNLDQVDIAETLLLVRGKGKKERVVPFGSKAGTALKSYSPLREELLQKKRRGNRGAVCERSRRKANHALRAPHCEEVRNSPDGRHHPAPALPAPRLCHAPAGRGGRPASHPGAAGAQQSVEHPEVHPHLHPPPDGSLRQDSPQGLNPEGGDFPLLSDDDGGERDCVLSVPDRLSAQSLRTAWPFGPQHISSFWESSLCSTGTPAFSNLP